MDEKTEELRDIFVDVAGEETVTESQTEGPGSLVDTDDATVDERLAAAVERMAERYEFDTGLDTDAYVAVVRGFYASEADETIAADIDVDADTVFAARMDLHLIGGDDTDLPVDLPALRAALADGDTDVGEVVAGSDADESTVERAVSVAAAQNEARRVSHRFQSAFEDVLTDAGLADQLTASIQEDGLDEAAEDIETDLSM
jgi:hypothetical protein